MPTSDSKVFCRVNRRRPCRICGKPDWRSFTRNGERISICMRVSDGARKINRHGGAIFIHDDWREEQGIGARVVADIPQSPIAPIEIRDFIYGRLIEHSPATFQGVRAKAQVYADLLGLRLDRMRAEIGELETQARRLLLRDAKPARTNGKGSADSQIIHEEPGIVEAGDEMVGPPLLHAAD
jgi:hypothetical protein